MSQHKSSMTKHPTNEVKKQEEGERTFFKKKKRRQQTRKQLSKRGFWKERRVRKRIIFFSKKGQKKDNQIKEYLQKKKDTFKKDNKKKNKGKYVSLLLSRWMEWPRRALGKNARSRRCWQRAVGPTNVTDCPCQRHSIHMPPKTQREGWEGKNRTTYSRKGAQTTARPQRASARPTGGTCAKHIADICYTASGSRAET